MGHWYLKEVVISFFAELYDFMVYIYGILTGLRFLMIVRKPGRSHLFTLGILPS